MRTTQNKTPWESHDWKVKPWNLSALVEVQSLPTPAAPASEGSPTRLQTIAWATSNDGTALADEDSARWLAEPCLRRPGEHDHKDRLKLKYLVKPEAAK